MEEIKKVTYKTASKLIADTTVAGTYFAEVTLDDSYDMCTGIAVTETSEGLGSDYTVAIGHQNNAGILPPLPADAVVVGKKDGSNPNQRFLDLAFSLRAGNKMTVTIVTNATASADITIAVTFKCVQFNKPVSI